MKICPNCKNGVEDDVKLCPNCNTFIASSPLMSQQEVNAQDNNKQVSTMKKKLLFVLALIGLVVAITGLIVSILLIPKYPVDKKNMVGGGNFELLFDGLAYIFYSIIPLTINIVSIMTNAVAMKYNNKINIKSRKLATFGLIISIISILICLGGCVTCAYS